MPAGTLIASGQRMFHALHKFFENRVRPAQAGEVGDDGVRLATAALLMEMARADFTVQEVERREVAELLRRTFELSGEETAELVSLAEQASRESVSLQEFTRLINRHFPPERKEQVVRLLWEVAFADARIDKYEEYLVRKVADLLYVSHTAFIRAKLAAQERALGPSTG